MARENCPRCGETKHQLNRCPSCGFQRNKQFRVSKISRETEARSETHTPETQLKSNKEAQNVIKRKRSIETKKKIFSGSSIRGQSEKKSINKKRPKKFGKKKASGAGSIMYGLIDKTSTREWHHVK